MTYPDPVAKDQIDIDTWLAAAEALYNDRDSIGSYAELCRIETRLLSLGLPVPKKLKQLEYNLEIELVAESQGR